MSKDVGVKDKMKALLQWCVVGPVIFIGIILTMLLGWAVILTAKRQPENPFGLKSPHDHDDKYIKRGSSGTWYYFMTTVPVLKWFGNLEDGLYREPSGKNSAACKGKEKTFFQMYLWLFRNPFNYAKRMTPFLACFVNECDVVSIGDEGVTDKSPDGAGSYWVVATHRNPKSWHWKKYYGYRRVFFWMDVPWYKAMVGLIAKLPGVSSVGWFENRVYNAVFGYKIKPEHSYVVQEEDDRDKALTFRVQFWARID